jgi:hypothetical protein
MDTELNAASVFSELFPSPVLAFNSSEIDKDSTQEYNKRG